MNRLKGELQGVAIPVLLALSGVHLINDLLQTTVTASYPLIKDDLGLSFSQIGSISLVYLLAASMFQFLIGMLFDRHPFRGSILIATGFTMIGIIGLSYSTSLWMIYCSVFTVGIGSSIIHPEASRFTSLASGGKRGLAQSIFQVGGNFGGSIGPLLMAAIVAPTGRRSIIWFVLLSAASFAIASYIAHWFKPTIKEKKREGKSAPHNALPFSIPMTIVVVAIICILIISKYIYLESIKSYYTFYLIHKFGLTIQGSQVCLFVFLFATAAGTLIGGPVGDRIGRKYVILLSILGTAPFSLAMPGAGFGATIALSFCSGFVLSSAFPAILLYAQDLLPNMLGLISGIFFGFAFGVGGAVSVILGNMIDLHGIETVYRIVSFSPLLGLVAIFLPNIKSIRK